MKGFMKRFKRWFCYGEKGFTLIELLIVIAVLGTLAAVVVPNVGGFLGTANLATSNQEATNVKTAAVAYLAETGAYPLTSGDLTPGKYINAAPNGTYTFGELDDSTPRAWVNNGTSGTFGGETRDANSGQIASATAAGLGITKGLTFDPDTQAWEK